MRVKFTTSIQLPVMLVFLFMAFWCSAQSDSLQQARQDSLLDAQQQLGNALVSRADSLQLADSLEAAGLLQELENLQASDQLRKAELQARLDSLQQEQVARDARIKQQVDSLRANTPGIPVVLFGDTVFYIYAKLGPFSPSDRAASITGKVELLVDKDLFKPELLQVYEGEESHDLIHGDIILLSVTDRDAFWQDQSRGEVADQYSIAIRQAVLDYRDRTGVLRVLTRIGLLLLVIIPFYIGIRLLYKGFTWLNGRLLKKGRRFIKGIKIRNYEFISAEKEVELVRWVLKMLKWITLSLVVYLILPAVFSIFPATAGIATTLFGYILNPIKSFVQALIGYIPELITILVIMLITFYFVKFLRFLAHEVETEKLRLAGFYPDWAQPTFSLLRILVYSFAFIMIFPYLPGSDSPIFQGVTVFLGLLISLGSSSAIGNIIAGLVITYMRPFKIGDRVKIGDAVGDVTEKTMLVTRLRTTKNEDITIPNSFILNESTINYSSSAKELGVILNTTVTIGYDVPWRQVHELLIGAASKVEHVKTQPQPFVLQTSLDDFYVSYQLNAYTEEAGLSSKIYSQLHANIQDAFNAANVEILSPHYRAARDGNLVTIPAEYLPPDYRPPAFNIKIENDNAAPT